MSTQVPTEKEMRDAEVPWLESEKELICYIQNLVEREHDYGTCVYAMSMAATAAFNYVAHKLGATGFQASCADLDILRRVRNMKGPFILLKAEDALYPQYDLHGRLAEAMESWEPWLKEQATNNLTKTEGVHPAVKAHWKTLAEKTVLAQGGQ